MRNLGMRYLVLVGGWVGFIGGGWAEALAQSTQKPPAQSAQKQPTRSDLASSIRRKEHLVLGRKVLVQQGCTGCHRLDLDRHIGPGLAGLWNKPRAIQRGGKRLHAIADREALLRALREPQSEIREGYAPVMPAYRLAAQEEEAILAVLRDLSEPQKLQEARTKGTVSLWHVILGALLFVFGHLGLSSLAVRRRLSDRLGNGAFQGLYSIIALTAMLWMSWGWSSAPYVELWVAPAWTRYLPLLGMPVVCVLFVLGVSTPSPTTAGQENRLSAQDAVQGILKITRHPSLWSFALWGMLHIPTNGDLASVILFGSVTFLALVGMAHIDARRRATQGEAWQAFAQQTSALPFLAVIQGRTRLTRKDVSLLRLSAALVVYVALLYTHTLFVGVSPFPYR
ncbi:hypothetical protein L6R29_08085 [Myxococcota bacterium]|nr:hypothetical protein [Myxococcota bacterium]